MYSKSSSNEPPPGKTNVMDVQMPRLIWVFAGRICYFVGFVMRWPKSDFNIARYPRHKEAAPLGASIHLNNIYTKTISEDTQEMPQLRSTFPRHQQKKRYWTNNYKTNATYETTNAQRRATTGYPVAFYVNLQRAVSGLSATLTGR